MKQPLIRLIEEIGQVGATLHETVPRDHTPVQVPCDSNVQVLQCRYLYDRSLQEHATVQIQLLQVLVRHKVTMMMVMIGRIVVATVTVTVVVVHHAWCGMTHDNGR